MSIMLEALRSLRGVKTTFTESYEECKEPENIVAEYDVAFIFEDGEEDEDTVCIWGCPSNGKYLIGSEYFDLSENLENKLFDSVKDAVEAYKAIAVKDTVLFKIHKI